MSNERSLLSLPSKHCRLPEYETAMLFIFAKHPKRANIVKHCKWGKSRGQSYLWMGCVRRSETAVKRYRCHLDKDDKKSKPCFHRKQNDLLLSILYWPLKTFNKASGIYLQPSMLSNIQNHNVAFASAYKSQLSILNRSKELLRDYLVIAWLLKLELFAWTRVT